jgi:type I restriction enzyme, S subunit
MGETLEREGDRKELENGMSGWQECKLGEQINLKRGYDLPNRLRQNGEIPIYSSSGITGFHSEKMCEAPGVITGRYGTIGKIFFSNTHYWPLNTTLYIQDFKGNDELFFYYFLQRLDWEKYSDKSAVPGINRNDVHQEDIVIPPLLEQKAIASILSSLDDKIDLLHRQNRTLEAIAETLFRQWFIEEAQADWEVGSLKSYLDIGIGRTPPRKEHQWFSDNSEDVKWISIKDLGNDGSYIFNTAEYLTHDAVEQFNIPIVPENTVLLSFKMTVGRVAITTEQMLSNEAIAHFKFRPDTPFTVEYLYLYLKNYQYALLGSTSSIVTSINSAMIKDMEIVIPHKTLISKFDDVVRVLFEKIRDNQQQICTLEKLRDTLLPKLMSGEVQVKLSTEE